MLAAAAVFVVGSLPYLLVDPLLIVRRVFGYGGIYGDWGMSRLLQLAAATPALGILSRAYFRLGTAITFLGVVAVSFLMDRLPRKPSVYSQCGVVTFTFMLLTPAFGVQYLAWLVPWVVAGGVSPTLIYYVTSGLFLFLVYWPYAHQPSRHTDASLPTLGWGGSVIPFELLCWVSVGVVLVLLLRRAGVLSSRAGVKGEDTSIAESS